jgi:hypothetical protein
MTERVLSLSESADILNMKRSNTAKFLARRNVRPKFQKAQGSFWLEADILRVKAEREADPDRMAADERRRRAALRRAGQDPDWVTLPVRVGRTQREVLAGLLRRPLVVVSAPEADRMAARRLMSRGFVEAVPEEGVVVLTDAGREIARLL